jgi:adenosine deaminase
VTNIDPAIPLVDLHRHLDGNLRLETVLDLGRRHGIPLPADDVAGLRAHVQVTAPQPGLMAFIGKMEQTVAVLADLDACRRVAYENVEDARREGLAYAELRFSPRFMAEPHDLPLPGVVTAVVDGVRAGSRDAGVPTGLIGILSRTYGVAACWDELAALQEGRDAIVALDLAGDEAAWPAAHFVEHFRRARDLGWHVTAHAGEAAGPESVWAALRDLGAERIGHGLRAVEDPALLAYLAEHGIGLEVSLTSNVQTSAVPDYAHHPVRAFVERGVPVALCTDDPGISGIDLRHEYEEAAPAAGLTPAQIRRVQAQALAMAFLPSDEKEALIARQRAR